MANTPATPQPPVDGNQNRGPALIAIFTTECLIALAVVLMRLYARISIKSLGVDDWIMFLTMLLFVVVCGLTIVLAIIGGARHLYYLTPEQINTVIKYNWITQPFAIVCVGAGKISTACLILRIMGTTSTWRKLFLHVSMGFTTIATALGAIFIFVQCMPPRALWEKVPGSKCWDPQIESDYQIFNASWNCLMDLALALLPITIIYKLKMRMRNKISLCAILGLGVFASVSSAVKASTLNSLEVRSDLTWATYELYVWASAEMFIIIVLGSIPTLKPLYERLIRGHKHHGRSTKDDNRNRSSLSGQRVGRHRDLDRSADSDQIGLNDTRTHRTFEISSQGDNTRSYPADKGFESAPSAVLGHNLV